MDTIKINGRQIQDILNKAPQSNLRTHAAFTPTVYVRMSIHTDRFRNSSHRTPSLEACFVMLSLLQKSKCIHKGTKHIYAHLHTAGRQFSAKNGNQTNYTRQDNHEAY